MPESIKSKTLQDTSIDLLSEYAAKLNISFQSAVDGAEDICLCLKTPGGGKQKSKFKI